MKYERYECDRCHKSSNGDIGDWFTVRCQDDGAIEVFRLERFALARGKDACGEACAMSLVAEAMRGLPR